MVAPTPTSVASGPPCSTEESCTLAPRRTMIGPKSARSTAPYQTEASSSTCTSPTRVAVGAIQAVGLTTGSWPSKENSGTKPSCTSPGPGDLRGRPITGSDNDRGGCVLAMRRADEEGHDERCLHPGCLHEPG